MSAWTRKKGYSSIALALHALTSHQVRFIWSAQAKATFQKLKGPFSSSPFLLQPDLNCQFIVEVDASDVGIGAVLSQCTSKDNNLHPCAFPSHKLSPVKKNYDMGKRELMAVKVALEEWLEGAETSTFGLD